MRKLLQKYKWFRRNTTSIINKWCNNGCIEYENCSGGSRSRKLSCIAFRMDEILDFHKDEYGIE